MNSIEQVLEAKQVRKGTHTTEFVLVGNAGTGPFQLSFTAKRPEEPKHGQSAPSLAVPQLAVEPPQRAPGG